MNIELLWIKPWQHLGDTNRLTKISFIFGGEVVPYISLVYAFNSPLQQVVIHPCHQGQLQRWQPTENQHVHINNGLLTKMCVFVTVYIRICTWVCVCVCVCMYVFLGLKGVRDISTHVELSAWGEGSSVPEVPAGMVSIVVGVAT